MNTAEMWIEAQKTGDTYDCIGGDVSYSKKLGLHDRHSKEKWELWAWDNNSRPFDELMNCEWKVNDAVRMTKKEVLKKFNVEVID